MKTLPLLRKLYIIALFVGMIGMTVSGFSYYDQLLENQSESIDIGIWDYSVGLSTPQEFYDFATSSTSSSTDVYHLENDIDFSSFTWDYNSSFNTNTFKGILDGRGFSLNNITVSSSDTASTHLSIFSQIDGATIKNISVDGFKLGISNTFLSSSNLEPAVFASNAPSGHSTFDNITINDIELIGTSIDGTAGLVTSVRSGAEITISNIKMTNATILSTSKRAGALISRAFNGAIGVHISDVDIQANIAGGNNTSNTAGIIGTLQDLPFTLTRAIVEYEAEGTVQLTDGPKTVKAVRYAGGFIGNNNNDDPLGNVITDSFFTGTLYTQTNTMGSAVGRERSNTTTLTNTFYSNVLFNTSYTTPSSTTGLHSTLVNASSMPSVSWWNTFSTTFYSANSLWTQNATTGRLELIR